jgi:hypothetical protein
MKAPFGFVFLVALSSTPVVAQVCSQATQKLQVPDQIHLVGDCQVSPEISPNLSFLFSERGIDIYRMEWPPKDNLSPVERQEKAASATAPLPRLIQRQALFVFQDEEERKRQIQGFINAGEAISWFRGGVRWDSTLPADWTPVLSVKYAVYTFTVFTSGGGVLLTGVSLYAPSECYAYNTRCVNGGLEPSVLKSSEIAEYLNRSPDALPLESLEYRVAMMMLKQAQAEKQAQKTQSHTPSSAKHRITTSH